MASRSSKAWNSLKTTSAGSGLCCLLLLALAQAPRSAQAAADGQTVDGLYLKATVRSPVQISAFYEARGFPAQATTLLARHCFITVIVRNRSDRVVWLEPGRWAIRGGEGNTVTPLSPGYWERQWDKIGLSAAKRSTFRWSQLPQSRDLQPHEPVGGNLSIPRIPGDFTLDTAFATGSGGSGPVIRARFPGLRCGPGPVAPK